MTNKILHDFSETTGLSPDTTVAGDAGEVMANVTDRKIYMRDSTGAAVIVADRLTVYSEALAYAEEDLAIRGTQFLQCRADIPAKPFDAADWEVISPPGDAGSAAILQAPPTPGHNTIDLTGKPDHVGMTINADPNQSADLFRAGGTGPDGARSSLDAWGIPNAGMSGSVRRVVQVGHPFTSRGQPVAMAGSAYVLADANVASHKMVGIVEEVLDSNAFIVRWAGHTSHLQASAFPGASITTGATYYVGSAAGSLSLTPPTGARRVPVVHVVSGTVGIVLVQPEDNLSTTGGTMLGGLSFGSQFVSAPMDVSRHIALYGTTSGISVTSGQAVNITSRSGDGAINLYGTASVAGDVYVESDFPQVNLVDADAAPYQQRMQMHYSGGTAMIRPMTPEGPGEGGLSMEVTAGGNLSDVMADMSTVAPGQLQNDSVMTLKRVIDVVHPVGVLMETTNAANPGTYIPGTTWEAWGAGRATVGVGTSDLQDGWTWSVGQKRGSEKHTLLQSEMPQHTHSMGSSGGHTHSIDRTTNLNGSIEELWADEYDRDGSAIGRDKVGDVGETSGSAGERWRLTYDFNHDHTMGSAGSHAHIINSTGGNFGHDNVQPSIGVYRWRRVS